MPESSEIGGAGAESTAGHTIHWAFLYDVLANVLFLGREGALREMTVDLAGLKPGESVLDVGCGTGTLALAAKRRVGPGVDVFGIDASPEMIARAQARSKKRSAGVAFRQAAVERLPFLDGQFDVVLSSLMLHHLPDDIRARAFTEIRRVLKPTGRFLAVDYRPPANALRRSLVRLTLGRAMADYDIGVCVPQLEAAGFRKVESGPTRFGNIAFLRARPG